jgi:hypothetical protein
MHYALLSSTHHPGLARHTRRVLDAIPPEPRFQLARAKIDERLRAASALKQRRTLVR